MLEVGWTEMLVIAIIMIVVVGPKDLPNMLRSFGRMTAKMRSMANDFRRQFDEALKEAELEDVKKSVESLRSLNPMTEVKKQLNPFEKAAADLRAGVDQAMKPKTSTAAGSDSGAAPAAPAQAGKNGAAEPHGPSGPETAPPSPAFPAMTDASVTASAGAGLSKPASSDKKAAPKALSSAGAKKTAVKPAAPVAKAGTAAAKGTARPVAKSATSSKGVASGKKASVTKPTAAKKTARTK